MSEHEGGHVSSPADNSCVPGVVYNVHVEVVRIHSHFVFSPGRTCFSEQVSACAWTVLRNLLTFQVFIF